jgi:hypothetical protein
MPLSDDALDKLLKVFSEIYSQRQVYRVLAERVPGWKDLFDSLIADPEHQKQVAETFSIVRKRLKDRKQIEEILQRLDKGHIH